MTFRERIKRRLSRERGTVIKDPGGRFSLCLIYPNTYYVGMSNLGFQGIYGLLNSKKEILCERAFMPDEEELKEITLKGTPLFSYESMRPLQEFDILAFSVSFENDYPNILRILELSRIPLRNSERDERFPIVVGGGVSLTANPEPVADFFDIIMLGDGEVLLEDFLDVLREFGPPLPRDKEIRKRLLRILSKKTGFYIPSMYEVRYGDDGRIKDRIPLSGFPEGLTRASLEDLNRGVRFSILTPDTEFSEMHLIEVMRGCPWKCHFCLTGNFTPLRIKSLETVLEEMRTSQAKRFGIIGSSLTDYKYIKELLLWWRGNSEGAELSLTSLRASPKSAEIIELLKNKKTVSIAPEAGSERLRRLINKKIIEEEIINTSDLLFREGIENLRLYFMIGLPGEMDEDVHAIVELVKKIRSLSHRGSISLSISIFVPKAHTVFERSSMADPETVKKRLTIIKRGLKGIPETRVLHELPKYAYMQGLFSQGSRRVSKVLEHMLYETNWKKASKDAGIDPDFYIFREKDNDEILPWDFIK